MTAMPRKCAHRASEAAAEITARISGRQAPQLMAGAQPVSHLLRAGKRVFGERPAMCHLTYPSDSASIQPMALFGGPLVGNAPVRFIYIDEAGISAKEPATVVVGVIVHADTQWRIGERLMRQVLDTVPAKFRPGFVSHAKAIWGDPKYRADWDYQARFTFLCRMMAIPITAGLTVSWAVVSRDAIVPGALYGWRKEQVQHAEAFQLCAATADKFVRDYCGADELATLVAEDSPDVRTLLRSAVAILRTRPEVIPIENVIVSELEGKGSHQPIELKVQRIVDTVHYAAKRQAIFLQIADACAFAIRRHVAGQSCGDDFVKAMCGGIDPGARFRGPRPQGTHTGGLVAASIARLGISPLL